MAKKSSEKPTGLDISRNGNNFVCTWKRKENYDKQQFKYIIDVKGKKESWLPSGDGNISHSLTKKTISAPANDYYPKKTNKIINKIKFKVRGKKNGKNWSEWAEKSYEIKAPAAPVLSVTWDDNSPTSSTYAWTDEIKKDTHRPFYNIQLQTQRVDNAPKDITQVDWKGVSSSTYDGNDGTSYTEPNSSGPFTRCVRIRARGLGGNSKWVYGKHVFADPIATELLDYKTSYDPLSSILHIYGKWPHRIDDQHPIDKSTLRYCVGVPSNVWLNPGLPINPSWNDVETISFLNEKQSYTDIVSSKDISQAVQDDECVWVQVKTRRDGNDAYSQAYVSYIGKLTTPVASISSIDTSTHRITIAATSTSQLSFIKYAVVLHNTNDKSKDVIIGYLGSSDGTKILQCPSWIDSENFWLEIYSFIGTQTFTTDSDGVRHYKLNATMTSDSVQVSEPDAPLPVAPVVSLKKSDVADSITVSWTWPLDENDTAIVWEDANQAEISWSDNKNAWRSTEQPSTFVVTDPVDMSFDIGNLTIGTTYYVRVRLMRAEGEAITYGPYSNIAPFYFSEAPALPVVSLSSSAVEENGIFTVSWVYVSMDGTGQQTAVVAEKVGNDYIPLANVNSDQFADIDTSKLETPWTPGTNHKIAVRVTSESNQNSGWSNLVNILYMNPVTAILSSQDLVLNSDDIYELHAMPFRAKLIGAGTAGNSTLIIERKSPYKQDRPDETEFNGFAGEVVYKNDYPGENEQTITLKDLIPGGHIDDTAHYTLRGIASDAAGQSDEKIIDFLVNFTKKPVKPTGTVAITDSIASISIGIPQGANNDDTVDIYRLSADAPELVYQDAPLGETIIDPYPAIGDLGGYRLVLKTSDGDYTMTDTEFAWTDISSHFNSIYQYIDFNGEQLRILYNVELSFSFEKDFTSTKYLGGSIAGDWLEGVKRTGSIQTVLLTENNVDDIRTLRKLATYSGPCQIRTKDGSSFAANVNTSESSGYNNAGKPLAVTLSIEKTDKAELDGQTLQQWNG